MWSVYLLTIRWANKPGPGSPLAMGIAGFGAAITTSPGSGMRNGCACGCGRWLGSVRCGPGATGSGPAPAGLGVGVSSVVGGAGWESGCGAGMGSDSWAGLVCRSWDCDWHLL